MLEAQENRVLDCKMLFNSIIFFQVPIGSGRHSIRPISVAATIISSYSEVVFGIWVEVIDGIAYDSVGGTKRK